MAYFPLKNAPLILLLFSSCAHVQQSLEARKFERAKYLLSSIATESYLKDCGVDLLMSPPETLAIESDARGEYWPGGHVVFYPKGRYSTLTHEYTHALLHSAKEECKDEILAAYAQWIDRLLEQNKRLRLQGR